jgi:DNA polymerase III epsilon subunit-like protein
LGTRFGIPFDESELHNAEADVNLLAQVFQRLVEQLNALPPVVKDYLLFLLPPDEWATANFIAPYDTQGNTRLGDWEKHLLENLHAERLSPRSPSAGAHGSVGTAA